MPIFTIPKTNIEIRKIESGYMLSRHYEVKGIPILYTLFATKEDVRNGRDLKAIVELIVGKRVGVDYIELKKL
jgi:hypothetical protein